MMPSVVMFLHSLVHLPKRHHQSLVFHRGETANFTCSTKSCTGAPVVGQHATIESRTRVLAFVPYLYVACYMCHWRCIFTWSHVDGSAP